MLAALLLVGGLATGMGAFVTQASQSEYHQGLVKGAMHLVRQSLLKSSSELVESRIDAIPHVALDLYYLAEANRVLLEPDQARVSYDASGKTYQFDGFWDERRGFSLRVSDCKQDELLVCLAPLMAQLLQDGWAGTRLSLADYVASIQPYFGYELTALSVDSVSSDVQSQFLSGARYAFEHADSTASLVLVIPNSPMLLVWGPIAPFNKVGGLEIVLISSFCAALIALGVYQLVIVFETRLRKLQQATERLSQGYLNVRIHSDGNGPINRLGISFNKMAEHIQHLISVQREMIRAVSHELRTPVARIRFAAQIMEDATEGDRFLHKQLAGMDSDIQELDELIDEILTYAKLEEGGPILEFKQDNVAKIAEQVVTEARPPNGVLVDYSGDDPVVFPDSEIEPRYVHRAIQNLVGNAGRYAKSRVLVKCSLTEDICRVDVEDDGPGIPKEDWDRVFNAFARLDDSRTRSSGGYGLGLSIVKRIMHWHSGQSMVSKSDALGGAKFSLVWPRSHNVLEQ